MPTQMTKIPKAKLSVLETEQLAAYLCGLDPDEAETDDIMVAVYEKFNIDLDDFNNLISYLLPMIDVGKSAFLEKIYKGFGYVDKDGMSAWAVKMEIPGFKKP